MSIKIMTHVWEYSTQKGTALLLLLALADSADDAGQCYPGIAYLGRKVRMSERNTQRLLARLIKAGELRIDYNQGIETATGYTNLYIVVTPSTGTPQFTRKRKGVTNLTPLHAARGDESDTPGVTNLTPKTSVETSVKETPAIAPAAQDAALPEKPSELPLQEKQKTPRARNPLFDAICSEVLSINPMDTEATRPLGARIGKVVSFLKGRPETSPEKIKAFVLWYKQKYPGTSVPFDEAKFARHWLAFEQEQSNPSGNSQNMAYQQHIANETVWYEGQYRNRAKVEAYVKQHNLFLSWSRITDKHGNSILHDGTYSAELDKS